MMRNGVSHTATIWRAACRADDTKHPVRSAVRMEEFTVSTNEIDGRPFEVELRRDLIVPMADGTKLSGNLYLPAPADLLPVPVILDFIPYHKDGRGGIGQMDAWHRYFAAQGYGVFHVDFRGTGSSSGRPYGPFDARERLDGHELVEWIARQSWCTGSVGVWGSSYGGITALAIAETRPPHLRAIVPMNAPDDNYDAMFVHNGSRVMLWSDATWGSKMVASNLMPPLRYDGSGDWLRIWRERLDQFSPWLLDWNGSPPDPGYWERQRIDPGKIEVPCFIVGGWYDVYVDAAPRIFTSVQGPKRMMIGPWKHVMPETSPHEPIDALRLITRWWDRWLRDELNGVEDEPPVIIYVQGPGEWRSELTWPPERNRTRCLKMGGDHRLGGDSSGTEAMALSYEYDARAGVAALAQDPTCAFIPSQQDQHDDDRLSLCFTGDPVASEREITGEPFARIYFSVDVPVADVNLVAKLGAVTPDGQSHLISYNSVDGSRVREVGVIGDDPVYLAEFPLRPTAYRLKSGEQLRLAISGSNFPQLWPSPHRYQLRVHVTSPYQTEISIPETPAQVPALPPPSIAPPPALTVAAAVDGGNRLWVHKSLSQDVVRVEGENWGTIRLEAQSRLEMRQRFICQVDADHPEAATSCSTTIWRIEREALPIEARVETLSTQQEVVVDVEVDLAERRIYERRWTKSTKAGCDAE